MRAKIAALSLLSAFAFPIALRAEPLPPVPDKSVQPSRAPIPFWMTFANRRPEVDLDNIAISFDVGTSKLMVVWALRL